MNKLRVVVGIQGVAFEVVSSDSQEIVASALITQDDALSLVSKVLTHFESGGECSFPVKSYQTRDQSKHTCPVQLELPLGETDWH